MLTEVVRTQADTISALVAAAGRGPGAAAAAVASETAAAVVVACENPSPGEAGGGDGIASDTGVACGKRAPDDADTIAEMVAYLDDGGDEEAIASALESEAC